jgi:hypothetical protein
MKYKILAMALPSIGNNLASTFLRYSAFGKVNYAKIFEFFDTSIMLPSQYC